MEKFINTGNKDTRSGFGAGLTELGRTNDKVVALCADLTGSLKMNTFAKEHPDRFFQCGIAEADMIDVAAGLSLSGRIPFAGSFANFVTSRVYDQVPRPRPLRLPPTKDPFISASAVPPYPISLPKTRYSR